MLRLPEQRSQRPALDLKERVRDGEDLTQTLRGIGLPSLRERSKEVLVLPESLPRGLKVALR